MSVVFDLFIQNLCQTTVFQTSMALALWMKIPLKRFRNIPEMFKKCLCKVSKMLHISAMWRDKVFFSSVKCVALMSMDVIK